MSKFLTLWESDSSKMPTDPNERAALFGKLMAMTKKMLDEGEVTDWGMFAGGDAGYTIAEGTEADVLKRTMQFGPYVRFKVHPVLPIDEVAEVMKDMAKGMSAPSRAASACRRARAVVTSPQNATMAKSCNPPSAEAGS